MRTLINFEFNNFLVGIHKVLILILILKAISERILFDVFSIFKLAFYLGQKISNFLDVWP